MGPLLRSRRAAWLFLGGVLLAFVASALLAVVGAVPLKMLPFDNKNELALVIDMPRGTSLEAHGRRGARGRSVSGDRTEVTDYESYVGVASPMDFNGMVRHYYLRRGGHVGDIRINFLPKEARAQQSHEIALRIRPPIERIGQAHGANLKIVEAPPGPPVLSTVVAESTGRRRRAYESIIGLSKQVRGALAASRGSSTSTISPRRSTNACTTGLDRDKAALTGVSAARCGAHAADGGGGRSCRHRAHPGGAAAARHHGPAAAAAAHVAAGRAGAARQVRCGHPGALGRDRQRSPSWGASARSTTRTCGAWRSCGGDGGAQPGERGVRPDGLDAGAPRCRWATRWIWPGKGSGRSRSTCSATSGLAFRRAALLMIYVLLVAQTHSLGVPAVIIDRDSAHGDRDHAGLLGVERRCFTRPVGGYPTPVFSPPPG